MKRDTARDGAGSATRRIDARIAELGDWRGATLSRLRAMIRAAGRRNASTQRAFDRARGGRLDSRA